MAATFHARTSKLKGDVIFSCSWHSWKGCAMPPTLFEVSNITNIQYLLISYHFRCYEMLHPPSSKYVVKYFLSPYMTSFSQCESFSFCCHYHCPSPSPCCGVAGAGVTFCPEAPALGQYWKFPSTKLDPFPCWCAKLSTLLCRVCAGLTQTLLTGNCAEFIVFALKILFWIIVFTLKILFGPFLPNWKLCCPLFCNFSVWPRLVWLLQCYLFYISYQTLSRSQSWNQSELIRSLESEQPHHESAPPGVLTRTLFIPVYYASPHVTMMGPVVRYTNEKTVIHTFIYFNNINTFYTMFAHTWRPSLHQTKKKHTLTLMHWMCHRRNNILGYDRRHNTE